MRIAALTVLVLVGSACTIQDPTENTGPIKFVNDTGSAAVVAYCKDTACTATWWGRDRVEPGKSTKFSVTAGRGNLAVIVVHERGQTRCIRLTDFRDPIALSSATSSACHPPFIA